MTDANSKIQKQFGTASGRVSILSERRDPTTAVTVKTSSMELVRFDENELKARRANPVTELALHETNNLQTSRGSFSNPKNMPPIHFQTKQSHNSPSKSFKTQKERSYNQAILGKETLVQNETGLQNNGSKMRASGDKRLNSSDRQKRYKMSNACSPQHPTLLLKGSDDQETEAVIQLYGQEKIAHNTSRLFPNRQQSHPVRDDRALSQVAAPIMASPNKQPVLGLSLGVGVMMGSDGRFYASEGGPMPTTTDGSHAEDCSPSSAILLNESRYRQPEVSSYQAQYRTGNEPVKRAANSTQIKSISSQGKKNGFVQAATGHKVAAAAGNNYIRVNLNEYQEIFNTVQERHRASLQKQIRQPFGSGSKDDECNSNYKLRSPVGSIERRSVIFNHGMQVTADGSEESKRESEQGVADAAPGKLKSLPNYQHQNTQQPYAKSAHRMNSTNESSFTDQLFANKHMLPGGQSTFDHWQKTQQTVSPMKAYVSQPVETRPFILMKNKIEEGSKQLKHGVAQQIIATTSKTSAASQFPQTQSTNSQQKRKASFLSNGPLLSQTDSANEVSRNQNTNALNSLYHALNQSDEPAQQVKQVHARSYVQQQPSSQLEKTAQTSIAKGRTPSTVIQRHNSMEQILFVRQAPVADAKTTEPPSANYENYQDQPSSGQDLARKSQQLHYRVVSEKRASQPPLLGEEHPQTHEQLIRLIKQAVDPATKRNSVQVMPKVQGPPNLKIPQKGTSFHRMIQSEDNSKFNESEAQDQRILKQESTVEGNSELQHTQIDWIKRAIEVSHQKLADSTYLNRLQSDKPTSGNVKPQKHYIALGQPQINMMAPQDPGHQSPSEIDSPKKPDLTDSNVKRARLLMEKKKKQFQKWQETSDQHQTFQSLALERDLQVNACAEPPYKLGYQRSSMMNSGGNLVCVSGITYKSILPPQHQSAKPQPQLKLKGIAEHPLSNQQLLHGYQKNVVVQQNRPTQHKRHQPEKSSVQSQGIQGKNITIMTQNRVLQNQANYLRQTQPQTGAHMPGAFDLQMDADDIKALQLIQQHLAMGNLSLSSSQTRKRVLEALCAAETNSCAPQAHAYNCAKDAKSSQFGGQLINGNKVINNLIVFSHNGQTYFRNNDTNFISERHTPPELPYEMGEQDLSESIKPVSQPVAQNDMTVSSAPAQYKSQAAYMADQMVQLNIGSRSLSRMLQGAQLEAAFQHLAKKGALYNSLGLGEVRDLELAQNGQPMILLPSQQQSPRTMRFRARMEKQINAKKQMSPSKNQMRPGESNGSLSTKPATSTTLNSTARKAELEESKLTSPGKKGKKGKESAKQKVHIFHEWDDSVLRSHKINKAINTINNIIRLIFKNNKDSTAITCTNNSNSLGAPSGNRLIEDTRINELQKIAKQINITIPKRFESKQSLREFFHSREFILNLKIKMQNLLHKAILTANGMPASIIEANMCGNFNVGAGQTGKEENKIYLAKKFWVGPGNNFPIVKSVLKQRYWWQYGSEESFAADCDFIWTSWKKQKHIDFLTNVNKKHQAKLKQTSGEGRGAARPTNETTEQKITRSNSETKASKKRKDKSAATEQKEPLFSQAQVDKICLPLRLYNKLEQNKQLTNKKGVFVNMRKYYESLGQDPFKVLPLTFHTKHGVNDPEFHRFNNYYNALDQRAKKADQQIKAAIKQYYLDKKKKPKAGDEEYDEEVDSDDEEAISKIKRKYRSPQNTWIIKPGENTNRGQGITVVKTLRDVQQIVGRTTRKDGDRTYIIQKYIDYPLLVHKRKFDFRCYGLLTSFNGSMKGYCYQDGYVRTSCREFTLDDVTDPFIHLTNDAIQQKSEDYGKFENGNKMSLQDFSKVITAQYPDLDFDFHRDIFPQIQKLIGDTYRAAFHKIDPQRLQNCFELFGYDFMIDEDFRLYLIEVNTNPCLEVCCPLLARIIPEVLDNCFKIVLDPLFPSPDLSHNRKFQLNELPQEVKFLLVFDEDQEGEQIRANFLRGVKGSIREAVGEEDIESDKENELAEDDGDEAY